MKNARPIDLNLLDAVSAEAGASPRGRKNFNFHASDDFPAHRLLNAIEPGSYVAPHRHLDPNKDETMIALRGRLGVVLFDEAGQVTQALALEAGGEICGVDIPHGVYHSVLGCEPGTVMFESKGGPFRPLQSEEKAPWAPMEGSVAAAAYLGRLQALFVRR